MQVIAFLHTLGELPEGGAAPVEQEGRTLLVAPTNTLANWQEEFASWLPPAPRNAGHNPRRLTVDKVPPPTCGRVQNIFRLSAGSPAVICVYATVWKALL